MTVVMFKDSIAGYSTIIQGRIEGCYNWKLMLCEIV